MNLEYLIHKSLTIVVYSKIVTLAETVSPKRTFRVFE